MIYMFDRIRRMQELDTSCILCSERAEYRKWMREDNSYGRAENNVVSSFFQGDQS